MRERDEEAAAGGQFVAFGIEDGSASPELAAVDAFDAAAQPDGRGGGYGLQILDLKLARDGDFATSAVGFAHGFIEQRGDDAAVKIAGRSFVVIADDGLSGDGAIGSRSEGEVKADGILHSTAEAAVALAVGERLEGMGRRFRDGGIGRILADRSGSLLVGCGSVHACSQITITGAGARNDEA